ncbi:spore germination protein GerPC [Fodinisporobacter ferrooxydans]|uniref:Spore germination protein GerPC n=1 Tax=Fodinisporobacter ferrooxydans TaxID=2901836 RepID=A0ABY4CJ00_9BACL|nr:spore germination protein GerPC [Alicyclobacillaceae bacterium MYW30-H2]
MYNMFGMPGIHDVWIMLQQLQQRVERLERENEQLKQQLQMAMRIKRLEYHIEELHVRNLRGTLNIGITAQGSEKDLQNMIGELQSKENGPFHLKGEIGSPVLDDDDS